MTIGLTGQTGAGKSAVSRWFAAHGCGVIDADAAARAVVQKGMPCLDDIVKLFGEEVLLPDGTLNRRAVAGLIFQDSDAKKRYEAVIFPYITAYIRSLTETLTAEGRRVILLDAPTLFESGIDRDCARIIAVTAPAELRKARIIARDNISEEHAAMRMQAQHTEEFFREHADFVICNDGTEEQLFSRCQAVFDTLLKEEFPNGKKEGK